MTEKLGTPDDDISHILNIIGWRAALARLLPPALFVLALGTAAFAIAVTLRGHSGLALLLPIAIVALLAVAVVVLAALLLRGDAASVARRTDFELGLSERLSTSIGLSPATRDSAVARSLQADARQAARDIQPAAAIPLFSNLTGMAVVALLLALCCAAAAYAFTGMAPVTSPVLGEASETAPDQSYSADDIEVLAKLVADDAERRDSDYLAAVANSLKDLAQAARDGTPQQDLQQQLDALLDHAAAGYDGKLPDWMSQQPGNPGATLQNAAAFNAARQQAAAERALMDNGADAPRINSADMYTLNDDRMSRSAAPLPQGNSKPTEGEASREGELQRESLGGSEFAAKPMEDEAFESAGSLPVGAAAQSGKGESNIAGGGSQALAESAGFLETMADPSEVMSISSDANREGSQIRMHVPTAAELSAEGALTDAGGSWERQNAQTVSRQMVAPDASAVVARYFNRPLEKPAL